METVDLVVIGAGIRGIAVAKMYHQIHPDKSIMIFDSAETVGGCWAGERIYPGLQTNNVLGTFDFSDFDMTPEHAGVGYGNHIPGSGVHRYLCEAVKHYDLEKFLRLGTKVHSARLLFDDTWEISYFRTTSPDITGQIIAKKLVAATGFASDPYIPSFAGENDFTGLLFHYAKLKTHYSQLIHAKNVIVVGGNKAAWDVSYLVATSGGIAHMVMRPSGGGPSWAWPPLIKFLGRTTALPALVLSRLCTLFDPWPFSVQQSRLRNFLHRWTVGLAITKAFWNRVRESYRPTLGTDARTQKLMPWTSPYYMGTALSTRNYPTDWLELVRQGKIVVHFADVVSLSTDSVRLTGETVEGVDAVVCCTGWKAAPPLKFLPKEIEQDLGLPTTTPVNDDVEREKILKVREEI